MVKAVSPHGDKGIGLIEKKRLGLGKPNVIYVKNFMIKECPETETEEEQPEKPVKSQNGENHNLIILILAILSIVKLSTAIRI